MAFELIISALLAIIAIYIGLKIIKNIIVTAILVVVLLGILWYGGFITL